MKNLKKLNKNADQGIKKKYASGNSKKVIGKKKVKKYAMTWLK
jgi:hypothetical protein